MNNHIYKINNRFYLLLGVVFYVLFGGIYSKVNAQSTRLAFSIASQNPSITTQPIDNIICQNANANFSVAATSFTGSQPLTYQWQVSTNGGSSYSNITNNTTYSGATTSSLNITNTSISFNNYKYRVIVTNACNFTVTSISANLIVNSPSIISGPTAACVGNAITLTGSGTPNASLPWVSSNTSVATVNSSGLVSALSVGNTTINYIDNNGCSTNSTITIGSPPILTAPTSSTICSGSTLTINLTASNGAAPYFYSWVAQNNANVNGESTSTVVNSLINDQLTTISNYTEFITYTVTVSDNIGCISTSTLGVNVDPLPTANAGLLINDICQGSTISAMGGAVSGSATGGAWSGGAGTWTNANDPANATYTAGLTETDTITLTLTTSGGSCGSISINKNIIVNPKPSVSLLPSNVLCNGTSTGSITNTNTGGTSFTYNWQDSNFNVISTNQNLDNVAAGTYSVQVTNNFGCSATATETITEPPTLNVTHNGITTICSGSDLNISINSEGGSPPYATVWKATDNTNVDGETLFIVSGAGEIINDTLFNTTTVAQNVSYIYSVTDSNQCEYHITFDVTVLPLLTINVNASATQVCSGSQVTLTGSGNASNFSWNNGITNGVAFTPTLTQYYQVTGTDSNNCVGVDSVLIIVNPNPSVSLLPSNAFCNGSSSGSITNTNTGGTSFTYNWQDSNFNTISTNQNLANVAAGTYSVQVTNNFGCSATATETISEPPFLNLSVSGVNNPQCAGDSSGTISVIASGGTAPYQFSLISGVYSSSATFTGLTSGNYTVTAKDVNNCMINTSVTLVDSSLIDPMFPSTFTICSGSSFNLPTTSSNGITGTWNPPINNQVTTTYTFTPNAGQCSNTATTIVIVNQVNLMASASITDCGNSQGFIRVDSVIGAVGPFSYQLNNGTPQFNNPNFSGLQAGNYIVYATDANACVASANMNISSVQPLSINLSGNNLTCGPFTNASLNASVNGGTPPYQYNWLTTGNTDSIINITSSGTYTLVVYDLYSCSVTQTLTVIEPTPLTANITTQTNISCNGLDNGSATVNASGGTSPYTYSWNTNPVQTGNVAINLFAGNYQVTIKDTNNCLVTINVDITQPPSFTASPTMINNIGCNGQTLGSASVAGVGGVPPYYYSWSTVPAQTTDTAFNLSAGNYTVSVYDNNNCTATVPITITQSSAPNAITTFTDINCNGILNGSASVTVNGGTAPFTYEWNTTPAQTTPTINTLAAGNYMVIVRDSLNCRDTAFVTIAEPQALVVSITKTDITCFGLNNGSAIANANGGIAPYTFLWSNTQSSGSLFGLSSGNFTLDVTDANGCIVTNNISIFEPQLLEVSIVAQTNVVGVGVNNGTATASVNGGTTPYTFNWSHNPATNTNFVNDLPAGTHIVTVIDNNNCSDTATVIIITEQNYLLSENIITKTNVPFTFNIFTNDVGLSNFTTDTLPSSAAVNGTVRILQNGDVTYAPYLNFSGFDRVIVKACSTIQQVCLYDTIYITVKPNAQIDFSTTNGFANAVVATGNVLANDAGSGIQQSAQLISTVSNGTVTLDANGNFLYKPTRNYCGLDSFKYQICDTNNLCAITSCIFEVICRDVTVFTGFSPNGDGINDNWVIADIEGTINTVSIYDRWGRLVNSYTNYDNVTIVWDGTNSSGNQLISGTYFYAIEIENKPRRLGWIEITR